jgi:predicted phosphodiesterase
MADSYTVAIISDMHGNAAALEAVLADLDGEAYDALVVAGDLAALGPRPKETMARIRALEAPTILGNTDAYLVDTPSPPAVAELVAWVKSQLNAGDVAFLTSLPREHRITPPSGTSPRDDLLIVHATPTDIEAVLSLEPDAFGESPPTPEDEAAAMLGDAVANLIVFGHIHRFSNGTVRGQRLASVGAVGFPFDGDTRAAYGLATWDGTTWTLAARRVAYDHEAVIADLLAGDNPVATLAAERLRTARFIR